jgi:hypothetical protein
MQEARHNAGLRPSGAPMSHGSAGEETGRNAVTSTLERYRHSPIRLCGVIFNHGENCLLRIVCIATAYSLGGRGEEFEARMGKEFPLLHFVQTGSGVHPASHTITGGGGGG